MDNSVKMVDHNEFQIRIKEDIFNEINFLRETIVQWEEIAHNYNKLLTELRSLLIPIPASPSVNPPASLGRISNTARIK